MAVIRFSDLTIRSLPEGTYYDERTRGFGIVIGKHKKTWVIVRGAERARRAIGHYPAMSLSDARRTALRALGSEPEPLPVLSFAKARSEYLEKHGANLRPSSLAETTRILNRHFHWTKSLDKITHQDVLSAIEDIEAPSERAHAIKDIRSFFNWCIPRYLKYSPCTGIKQPRAKARERILSDDELRRIWKRAGDLGYPAEPIIKLLILTGQRRSEIAGLKWEWITDDINFPSSLMKNNQAHTIPLGNMAKEIIENVPRHSDILFPKRGVEGEHFEGFGRIKYNLDECGVTDYVFHDFRRTFSSTLARLGVKQETTERLLGHITGKVSGVAKIYNRYDYRDEQVAAIRRFEEWLTTLLNPTQP